jgi:hypothetical protein
MITDGIERGCDVCSHNKVCNLLEDYQEYCDRIKNSVADEKYDKFSYSTSCKYYNGSNIISRN